jgi:hypothetical protein
MRFIFPTANVKLRHYHADNSGELSGHNTVEYLDHTVNATYSTSEAYTPQRSTAVEQKFRAIGEITATMLHELSLHYICFGSIR